MMDQFRFHKVILLIYLLGLAKVTTGQITPITPFGTIRALVVGISDYRNDQIPDLQFAHRDAFIFSNFLENSMAWKVAPENIILLTNEQATYGRFSSELDALREKCKPKDRLIIYFSGHGDVEISSDEKEGYLLFYDANHSTYSASGACEVNTLNQLVAQLTQQGVEVILITDACRSGKLAGNSINGKMATTAALTALFQNTTKFLSCEPDQVSLEGKRWGDGRGLFSYYLVKGLSGAADDDKDQFVDHYELERYIKDSVRWASQKQQTPVADGRSSFRLAKVKKQASNFQEEVAPQKDSNFLLRLAQFQKAIDKGRLLFPEEGSAYAIYQSTGNEGPAATVKTLMKTSLSAALQDEAQRALSDYIESPGRELAKRWANQGIYSYYPKYLRKAAELQGPQSAFYAGLISRSVYFDGVNERLKADAMEKADTTVYKQALHKQQEALALKPLSPHIFNELGLLYRRLDQKEKEMEAFEKAHELSPTWPLALTNLAYTYKRLGTIDKAIELYKEAIQLNPDFALAHYNLAIIYQEQGKKMLEEQAYLKTLQADPQFWDAMYNLASLYVDFPQQYSEAEKWLNRYVQGVPDDPDGFTLLGYLYRKKNEPELARLAFESSLALNPEASYTYSNLADLYREMNDSEATIKMWTRVLEHNPKDFNAYKRLARFLVEKQSFDKAVSVIQRMINNGFEDLKSLREDQNLAPLKGRKDFDQLTLQ